MDDLKIECLADCTHLPYMEGVNEPRFTSFSLTFITEAMIQGPESQNLMKEIGVGLWWLVL